MSTSLGFVDQGLASIRPLILTLLALRAMSADDFGAFALLTASILIVTGLSNAFHAQVLLVRAGYQFTAQSIGSVVTFSAAVSTCVLLVAGAVGGGWVFVVAAVCLPFLLVFEFERVVAHGRRRYLLAIVMDGSWLMVSAVAMLVLASRPGDVAPATMLLAWGLGAVPGAVLATHRFALWSALLSGPGGWWKRGTHLGGLFTLDFALMSGAGQTGKYATGALGDLSGAGSLRAAELLGSPLSTFTQAMRLHVLGRGGHMAAANDHRRLKGLIGQSILWMTAACAVYYTAVIAASWSLLPLAFGDTWPAVWEIMGAVIVASVGRSLASSGLMALQLTGERRALLRTRVMDAGMTTGLSIGLTVAYGYVGAAWGLALANGIMAPVWLITAWRSLGRQT